MKAGTEITIKRDGINLHGILLKPEETARKIERMPILLILHGFDGDLGYTEDSIYHKISQSVLKKGLAVVRLDFDGHGKSQGTFQDMDVFREILDAIALLEYVKSLAFVSEIYVLGHSQGGVVGGMLCGLYPDVIKKLVLMAPAATLKTDAQKGVCMGTTYDTDHIPDTIFVNGTAVGGHYFRIAKILPIYETTSLFQGPTLLLHGIQDQCVDYHASVRYHEVMPKSELKLYEHLDHGIEGKDQSDVIETIACFLESS